MSHLQPSCCLKIDFQKLDQHAGGKWLIHDTKRRNNVNYNGYVSDFKVTKCGVPHRSSLWYLLFLIYHNNLPFQSSLCQLFSQMMIFFFRTMPTISGMVCQINQDNSFLRMRYLSPAFSSPPCPKHFVLEIIVVETSSDRSSCYSNIHFVLEIIVVETSSDRSSCYSNIHFVLEIIVVETSSDRSSCYSNIHFVLEIIVVETSSDRSSCYSNIHRVRGFHYYCVSTLVSYFLGMCEIGWADILHVDLHI